ncbi:hypothetical protein CHS0354_022244 [Potamilus streckersoni]|uniref:Uncharacterized protein n=1 Tax=Potamilus streckersoni TaxID=2493646 RepID=A0AAE0TFK1_9BIVA|nr:hypothetical protein CHS0354_022244 [Potamilus streckersoni]
MGNTCCGCLIGEKDSYSYESNSRTPLLGSPVSIPESRVATNDNFSSARRYRPPEDRKQFESSLEAVTTIETLSVPVSSVDKTFKDQANLYNELVQTYSNLREEIHNFKTYFEVETSGIPVLHECFRILVRRCGYATINIERKSKTFLYVSYNPKDVSEKCAVSPEQVLKPLEYYKNACKRAGDVLQHAPHINDSISVIVNNEKGMRREITKADLPGDKGIDGMKAVMSNITKLKQMKININTIQKYTELTFKELLEASKLFFGSNC